MCDICAKTIFRFELKLSSYWQNIIFSRNCPKFHIFTKIVFFFKVWLELFKPTASTLQISWQGHVGLILFHFCQLWAVKGGYAHFNMYIFFFFNWLTMTSEMHFVTFHPEVASCLLSRGKRKYAPLGMRLIWKYIRNYFLVYQLISHFL